MNDADLLAELRRRLPAARRQLEQSLGNIPGSGGAGSKGGHSDRTGLAATALADGDSDDIAARDLVDLERIEVRLVTRLRAGQPVTRDLTHLADLVARWTPTTAALDRIAAGPGTTTGADGCISCAKVPDSQGRPTFSPQHPGLANCQQCHADLRRVRARDTHRYVTLNPPAVIRWRRTRSDRRLTDDILDDLLSGKLIVP